MARRAANGSSTQILTLQDHHVEYVVEDGGLGRSVVLEDIERWPSRLVERHNLTIDHAVSIWQASKRQGDTGIPKREASLSCYANEG